MRDADPTRAVLVLLAFAVPVELDLDAAVFVGVDLFARGADDDGCLDTVDGGFGVASRGAEGDVARHAQEAVFVALGCAAFGFAHHGLGAGVFDAGEHVLRVEIASRVVG